MGKKYRFLHLGVGRQSSTIFCLIADGEIPPVDAAFFADTQEEPAWVYEQLEFLKGIKNGPPIVEVTAGKIGDHLIAGTNSTGQNFATIPGHTTYREGEKGGLTRRQCTREYKIEPIEKSIRRDFLKLQPRQRIPTGVVIENVYGFSTNESTRAVKMQATYKKRGSAWAVDFPLFADDILMSSHDCQQYMNERAGFTWRSSRCVICPLQNDRHFAEIKEHDPAGFERACKVDDGLRTTGSVANRDMNESMYVHRACRPLRLVKLGSDQNELFADDGGCDQGCFT